MSTGGINVGDAVLTFLGDTTNLDAAFASVGPKAEAGMGAATDAVEETTHAMAVGVSGAKQLGEVTALSGEKMKASMYEARGETALLGDMFGVKLPRHVRSFVAELPGVGSALSAAFQATAVLFLLEALVKGTEKLSDLIGRTFIYTDAMKAADAELLRFNQDMVRHNAEMAKLDETYKGIGLSSLEKLSNAQGKAAHEVGLYSAAVDRAKATLAAARKGTEDAAAEEKYLADQYGLTGHASEAAAEKQMTASLAVEKAVNDLAEATKRAALADREYTEALQADRLKSAKVVTDMARSTGETLIALQKARAIEDAVIEGKNKEELEAIEVKFINKKYALLVQSLEQDLAAEKKYGKDDSDAIRELNAKIENTYKEHYTVLSTMRTRDMKEAGAELEKSKKELEKILAEMSKSFAEHGAVEIIPAAAMTRILEFRAACKELGITLDTDLAAKIRLAQKTLNDYTAAGGKDVHMLEQLKDKLSELEKQYLNFPAQEKALKLKLAEARANHQNTLEIEKEIAALAKLEKSMGVQSGLIAKQISATQEWKSVTQKAVEEFNSGMETAMSDLVTKQKSFGASMESLTFSMLASMAKQWGTYYQALAIGEAASGDYGQAAESEAGAVALFALAGVLGGLGSALTGGGGGTKQGATFAQGGSVTAPGQSATGTTQNVVKLAAGGLITGPTLALLGEQPGGSREAVIPLNNPEAMRSIMEAIGGGNMTIHNEVSLGGRNMKTVMRTMTKAVRNRTSQLSSNTSSRVIKRGS
jgi:hypothetical protein